MGKTKSDYLITVIVLLNPKVYKATDTMTLSLSFRSLREFSKADLIIADWLAKKEKKHETGNE